MKISLAMIVKNEEKHIRNCLERVNNIVDEIVIVDTGSTDKTIEIAKEFDAKIYKFDWCNDFSAARNYAAEKTTGEWILVLDADEYVSVGDKETLIQFINLNSNSIGRIEQYNKYEDSNGISFSGEYISRFYPRGIKFKGLVHEQLDTCFKRIKMNFRVEHSGYYKTNKSERNLPMLLRMLEQNKDDTYILYQIGRTLYVDKKYLESQRYFEQAYGAMKYEYSYSRSLIIYYLYSIVNSNTNYEKGLQIINAEKEKYGNDADFNFVCGIFYLNLVIYNEKKYINYMPLIEKSYLKCLEIGEENTIVEGVGSFKAAYNLGTFYEVTGNLKCAYKYYKKSSEESFKLAKNRIKELDSQIKP